MIPQKRPQAEARTHARMHAQLLYDSKNIWMQKSLKIQ